VFPVLAVAHLEAEPTPASPSWLLRSPLFLRASVVVLAAAIFVADVWQHRAIALSMLYAIPILVSLWLDRRGFTLALALACCACALIGAIPWRSEELGPLDPQQQLVLVVVNRAAAIFSILVVASLGLLRLRTDRELRYVRKMALTTLRSLGDAVLTLDGEGRVRFVNRSAEHLIGRPRELLLGRPLAQALIYRDLEPARPFLVELAEQGPVEVHEATLFAFGGKRVPIEYTRATGPRCSTGSSSSSPTPSATARSWAWSTSISTASRRSTTRTATTRATSS
jgi:PAS domain S-box-containing protein